MDQEAFDFDRRLNSSARAEFASLLLELSDEIGFRVSSRGWCYILEQQGAINKDQFNKVESWVNACRREGLLPIDFVAEEASRAFSGVEIPASQSPVQDLGSWLDHALRSGQLYDVDWWKNETCYVQMVVEKIDLVTLFEPICQQFHIPIANSKGWSSMLQRAEYARRFQEAETRGMECVLLYCGDHDPAGLMISDFLRKNLRDLDGIVWTDGTMGYDPDDLKIERFGLNFDFIQGNGFSWINNLITGGGKDLNDPTHRHHEMDYVQEYIENYGARKCEANVLVTQPDLARALCLQAIVAHLGEDALDRFAQRRQDVLDYMDRFDEQSGVLSSIDDLKAQIDNEDTIMEDEPWDG